MQTNYNFNKGRRGAVVQTGVKKVRITIRLDRDIVDWFRAEVEKQGGGNYQTMLNDALRAYMQQKVLPLEEILRRVVREEMKKVSCIQGEQTHGAKSFCRTLMRDVLR